MAEVVERLTTLEGYAEDFAFSLNQTFILLCSIFIFVMQNGFAMLEAGSVRTKNTKNVLIKNVLDAAVGTLAFYLFGYAFAFGEPSSPFSGHGNFALSNIESSDLADFFFQWTFAATSATIVSGSVAERTSFYAYLAYTFFLTSFVYSVVAHWFWAENGWLAGISDANPEPLFGVGAIDFAGDAVVHCVGGFAGLVGAICVGPRIGRFMQDGSVNPVPGHSSTLVTLGTFLLWFGWYGFNGGSTGAVVSLDQSSQPVLIVMRVMTNTTLSAASSALVALIFVRLKDGIFDLVTCLNGVLAGLVAITGGCAYMEPYAAVAVGSIGAIIYAFFSWLLLFLQVDDPLDAFAVHGACGVWGMIATGLFTVKHALIDHGLDATHFGLLYGGGGLLLAANVVGTLTAIAWTVGVTLPFFLALRVLGLLRIPYEVEMRGNDLAKHGGAAYTMTQDTGNRREVNDEQEGRNDDNDEEWKSEKFGGNFFANDATSDQNVPPAHEIVYPDADEVAPPIVPQN